MEGPAKWEDFPSTRKSMTTLEAATMKLSAVKRVVTVILENLCGPFICTYKYSNQSGAHAQILSTDEVDFDIFHAVFNELSSLLCLNIHL